MGEVAFARWTSARIIATDAAAYIALQVNRSVPPAEPPALPETPKIG